MPTTINPSDAFRNAAIDAGLALANGGSIEIRSGTKPANGEATATGTVLAVLPLTTPAYAPSVAGTATLDADPDLADTAADATGTATWYRVLGSGGGKVFDGTCGVSGSGESLILSTVSIVTGGAVTILTGTFSANQ